MFAYEFYGWEFDNYRSLTVFFTDPRSPPLIIVLVSIWSRNDPLPLIICYFLLHLSRISATSSLRCSLVFAAPRNPSKQVTFLSPLCMWFVSVCVYLYNHSDGWRIVCECIREMLRDDEDRRWAPISIIIATAMAANGWGAWSRSARPHCWISISSGW